jgi:hypothetical protein
MVAKHREAALGLFPSGFVLNHVPMLHENSIVDSENVRGDPVDRLAKAGESAMNDDKISVGHNGARLIPKRRR